MTYSIYFLFEGDSMQNFFSPYLLNNIEFKYLDDIKEVQITVWTNYSFTDKNTRNLAEKLCHFYREICYENARCIIIKIVNIHNKSKYRTFVFNYLNDNELNPYLKYEK